MALVHKLLPIARWLPAYRRDDLPGDLSAGLTVAVMLIPQGMAYAMLAGLPPIVGLYASTLPLIVYALLGTSRQLAVGPVAMVSLMVATATAQASEAGLGEPVALAVLLALMVGAAQVLMGLARMGFLVSLLSHPVVSGFTSAAALVIGFSQLKHLLGVPLAGGHHVHAILIEAAQRVGEIHGPTLAMGVGGVVALLALKRLAPKAPAALVVVVAGTALTWLLGLDAQGVKVVGEVPEGLPPLALPALSLDAARQLLPTALAISLVGFVESISVATAFATRNRYKVDANQELIALGAANLGAAVVGGYPVTGGLSRTAVNAQAGARTPLATLLTAAMILLTLVLLTPLFRLLPKAILAAIVMVAVFGLIDLATLRHLLRVRREDALMLGITFVATLALGVELGIALGVGASILAFLRRTTSPHVAILGKMPDSDEYRNLARHPDARSPEGVVILRVDRALWFGNVANVRACVDEVLSRMPDTRAFILDMSAVNDIDTSGLDTLTELARDLDAAGIRLSLVRVKGPVMDVLRRDELPAHVGEGAFSETVHEAVLRLSASPAPDRKAAAMR